MENLIERCTSEKLISDNWALIMEVCEDYGSKQPKACLKSICKRIFQKNSLISLRAITLLDACSKNCGKVFNREVASRDFTQLVKNRFTILSEVPRVKLIEVFEKWAEEFKTDSELALAASLYTWIKSDHPELIQRLYDERQAAKSGAMGRQNAAQLKNKEEEELAKAIALSLKESEKKGAMDRGSTTKTKQAETITSGATRETASLTRPTVTSKGRVRALYDFEAAEDNELTFKAGELIVLLDDSDENWWSGSNHRGEGLFPAQFVQRESEESGAPKPSTSQPSTTATVPHVPVTLDESKLDECLHLISTVDPTGEFRPDPVELPRLEAECNAMAPLIDPELEKVDKRVVMLSDLNQRLLDAFQMYHDLMSHVPATIPYYNGTSYGAMHGTTVPGSYGPIPYGQQMAPMGYPLPDISGGMYHPSGPMSQPYPTVGGQTEQSGKSTMQPQEQHHPYAAPNVYPNAYPQSSHLQSGTNPPEYHHADVNPSQGMAMAANYPPAGTADQHQHAMHPPAMPYYYGYGQPTDGFSDPTNQSTVDGTSTTMAPPNQSHG